MISVKLAGLRDKEAILRGLLLHQAGEWDRAMSVYADVLRRHPKHAVAYYLMGLLFEAVNDQHRADDLLTKCIEIKPAFHEAWFNRGVVRQWLGRISEARADYERCLRLNPRFGAAYVNLGNVLMAEGDHEGALRAYDRATDVTPDGVEGKHNRSFVHLVRGDWEPGWRDYEERWGLPGHRAANPMPAHIPVWRGEPLEGKRICLVHEQGVGDTLMMLRYVAGLRFMGATVILRVPSSLERLCRVSYPACEVQADPMVGVYGKGNELTWPDCDYVLPFMSLPSRFGTRVDTVPLRSTPYLVAPSTGPTITPGPGFRVGFVWKGSKDHKNDRNRSTRLQDWAPLLAIPGIAWICLQQEVTPPERAVLETMPNVTWVPGLRDWADTAHVLTQCESLICCDTGLGHLASAMGLPTCILVSGLPDFRWLLGPRTDTAWYANTRVYRQPMLGDWATPITEIAARLRAIIHIHHQEAA